MAAELQPERKWYWAKSEHPLMFRTPEEVETWHPSVAYPVYQSEGCLTQILWPYGCLYPSEQAALERAIKAQQQAVIEAVNKLSQLTNRLAKLKEPPR